MTNPKPTAESHTEEIECPECGTRQIATVQHVLPWWAYVHECTKCGYVIMESEWKTISSDLKTNER